MAVAFVNASAGATAVQGTGGNVTPALPTSPVDGYLYIAIVVSRDNVASTLPTGWTLIYQANNGASTRIGLWYAWYKGTSPKQQFRPNQRGAASHAHGHECHSREYRGVQWRRYVRHKSRQCPKLGAQCDGGFAFTICIDVHLGVMHVRHVRRGGHREHRQRV
jgi:hypothetical protein